MMDIAVFDTNILIDFSYQNPNAQAIIRQCSERVISVITWIEFLTGVPEPQLETSKAFLDEVFDIIYPEEEIYQTALSLRRDQRLKLPDAIIYATAQSLSAPLITRDTKDFDEKAADIYVPYKI